MDNVCRPHASQIWLSLVFFSLIVACAAAAQTTTPKIASGEDLPVPGKPVAADHAQLSEHNIESMQTQPPQVEAEFLLSAAINHDHGATDWIESWLADGTENFMLPSAGRTCKILPSTLTICGFAPQPLR